jgi:hypothetical protein
LTETSKTELDELLPYAAFSYNTKTHSSTNYTPFEVVFGRQANVPLSLHRKPDPVYSYEDVVMDIRQKNQLTWSIARENSGKSKEKTKLQYDKTAKETEYKVGDYVYLKKEARSSKLDNLWRGPYKVVEINTPQNVTVLIRNKTVRVTMNRL